MVAMWAPADLFTPGVSSVTLSLKRGVTYLYEHTLVLALILIVSAAVIAVVETLKG